MCLPNTAHKHRVTAAQAHLAAFGPQRNLSFPEQLHQCFSRQKGFQRAPPGQSKLLGSCGSFLCLQLTWQSGRSRGFLLLCLGQQCKWCVQNSSGISREIPQGGEHFWLLVPCHVLLGVILCKLLAYGPLSFSFCQKMTYLSLQTSPAHAKF